MVSPVSSRTCLVGELAVSPATAASAHSTLRSTVVGRLTFERLAFVGFQRDDHVVEQIVGDALQRIRGKHQLFERLGVHEVIELAVGVEELHVAAFQPDILDPRAVVIGLFDGGAGAHVAELETDGCATACDFDVLIVQYTPKLVVFFVDIAAPQRLHFSHRTILMSIVIESLRPNVPIIGGRVRSVKEIGQEWLLRKLAEGRAQPVGDAHGVFGQLLDGALRFDDAIAQ